MATMSFLDTGKLRVLLAQADPAGHMKMRVLTTTRLAIGTDPLKPSWIIDLAKEELAPYDSTQPNGVQLSTETNIQPQIFSGTRRTGSYWFDLRGRRQECGSLKELLKASLIALEGASPGTLEKLGHIKPKTKRIVARDPKALFNNAQLSAKYSEKLENGWWMGTNNSAQEVRSWLERAVQFAGLRWGKDFNISG